MTEPPTLYSAGMVGNPANSGDSRISTRPGSLGNNPDAAGDGVYGGDARLDISRSNLDREQDSAATCGANSPSEIGTMSTPRSGAAGATSIARATSTSKAWAMTRLATESDATRDDETDPHITAIVLTGGRSTRFGADKASTSVAGSTLLDHVLADIHPSIAVIIVGPAPQFSGNSETPHNAEEPARSLIVTREDPPGGGPVAGVLAGLDLVNTLVCCVIATDMPTSAAIALDLAAQHVWQLTSFTTSADAPTTEASAVGTLAAKPSTAAPQQSPAEPTGRTGATSPTCSTDSTDSTTVGAVSTSKPPDALIPLDASGHTQPLCASYTSTALRRAASTLGSGNGASFRDLLMLLRVREVQLETNEQPKLFDIDTRADLARSRQVIMNHVGGQNSLSKTGGTEMLNDWAAAAASKLDLDTEVDVEVILDVAKEAAHGVARPAAPLTTFLLGYAVAKGADLQEAAAKLNALAETWPKDQG